MIFGHLGEQLFHIMNFIPLESEGQLDSIKEAKGYSVIFKHNTTCPISKMTRRNFEADANVLPKDTPVYFLDLLAHRDISNAIAERFNVTHESPQLLLIKDGVCSYHRSLYDISAKETAEAINSNV